MSRVLSFNSQVILTDRQKEILRLLRDGYNIQDITIILQLSHPTIDKELAMVKAMLSTKNTTEAVILSIRKGIISLHNNDYTGSLTIYSQRGFRRNGFG